MTDVMKVFENKRFVDMSVSIEDGLPCDPEAMIPRITYYDHKSPEQIDYMLSFFPGMKADELPDGNAWALEFVKLSTHSGTHIDAPYHYYPTMNNGERAWTADEIPLDWFIGHAVVLDLRDKADGYVCTSEDLKTKLAELDYTLKEGDIVLIHTGASAKWGTDKYMNTGCGVGREGTLWLLDQGVQVVGTDAWSWDAPFYYTAQKYAETGDASIIWEGHRAGMEKAYGQIEKLTNLDKIPPIGATFMCFPVKIKGTSGAWLRAVGVVDNDWTPKK